MVISVTHSKEQLLILANAATQGPLFAATASEHFTSDEMFIAAEIPVPTENL